jgi:hypothetical protein
VIASAGSLLTLSSDVGVCIAGTLANQDVTITGQTQLGGTEPFFQSILCTNGAVAYALALPTIPFRAQRYCISTDATSSIILQSSPDLMSGTIVYANGNDSFASVTSIPVSASTQLTIWSNDGQWFFFGASSSSP